MEHFQVKPIGHVQADADGMRIVLCKEYTPALTGLEGFGYINVLWWFHQNQPMKAPFPLTEQSPYKDAPEILGTFATRSPQRPNPIGLSCAYVTYIDVPRGIIGLAYMDAVDGTPVLDIKPYTPSLDRVESPSLPSWCSHWPASVEASEAFDWGSVFNF